MGTANTATVTTSIALPRPLQRALRAHARKVGRSVSAILRDAAARELSSPSEPTDTARFVARETHR